MAVWEAWEKNESAKVRKRIEYATDEAGGKGKGKSAQLEGDDGVEGEQSVVGMGALVVFACRHVWHKACLEKAGTDDGGEGSAAKDKGDSSRSGVERYKCPLCV